MAKDRGGRSKLDRHWLCATTRERERRGEERRRREARQQQEELLALVPVWLESPEERGGDGGGGRWPRADWPDRAGQRGGSAGVGTLRMVLGLAGAGGGDRGWAAGAAGASAGGGLGVGARVGGLRGGGGAAGDEAGEGGEEWAAAELAADHIVLPQDGLVQRRLRRLDGALRRGLRRRLHRPPGRGREGPGFVGWI